MKSSKPWTPIETLNRARELRREQSPIESIVWARLRAYRCDGLKFRRQHPIGNFIVDFYHHETRTVIELDGASHADQLEYDLSRQTWLMTNGYRVVRFTNSEVMSNLDGVMTRILEVCRGSRE